MAWPDVSGRAASAVLAVPLGSTEQHGPHLPLSTDTDVALALARRLAEARADILVAPPLAYGASGEHDGFPGTLSIGQEALELVLVELARSAHAFAAVLFVSAHGGNAAPLSRAVIRLRSEGRNVRAWAPGPEPVEGYHPDAHAGHTETSVMLALDPLAVDLRRAESGATAPIGELIGALRAGGVAAVSTNGVVGDPTGASAEAGAALMDAWTSRLVSATEGWP
jgi:creatinine amidohydrolase